MEHTGTVQIETERLILKQLELTIVYYWYSVVILYCYNKTKKTIQINGLFFVLLFIFNFLSTPK